MDLTRLTPVSGRRLRGHTGCSGGSSSGPRMLRHWVETSSDNPLDSGSRRPTSSAPCLARSPIGVTSARRCWWRRTPVSGCRHPSLAPIRDRRARCPRAVSFACQQGDQGRESVACDVGNPGRQRVACLSSARVGARRDARSPLGDRDGARPRGRLAARRAGTQLLLGRQNCAS